MIYECKNTKIVIYTIQKIFNFKMPEHQKEQVKYICKNVKLEGCPDQFDCEWYDENDKEHDGSIWIGYNNRNYYLEFLKIRKD